MNDPRDQYTDEQLRDIIERAVAQHSSRRRHPRFYAITGSHIYGFPSESSDIDIRGFHTAPAQEYAQLNNPQKEITINMDGLTDGFEDHPDVDMRSYELRHFGEHLGKANFNIMELIFEADTIMNGVVLEMDALRDLIRKHLPLDVPHSYLGMARSNYYNYLDPDKAEAYDPRPKKFLYVYRALLGAEYVNENEDIMADVRELGAEVSHADTVLIDDLIEAKQDGIESLHGTDLGECARAEIAVAFNELPAEFSDYDKQGYLADIDVWMNHLRR